MTTTTPLLLLLLLATILLYTCTPAVALTFATCPLVRPLNSTGPHDCGATLSCSYVNQCCGKNDIVVCKCANLATWDCPTEPPCDCADRGTASFILVGVCVFSLCCVFYGLCGNLISLRQRKGHNDHRQLDTLGGAFTGGGYV